MIRLLKWFWFLLFPRPRTIVRDDGFYRRIVPEVAVANDELDRSVDTDIPVVVMDAVDRGEITREQANATRDVPVSIPFGVLPVNVYIRGPRYRVIFDRLVSAGVDVETALDIAEMGEKKPISIPFATHPPRQRRRFDRIVTPRFSADVEELTHWNMDIRDVLTRNSIRDQLTEEDRELSQAATPQTDAPPPQ